MRTWFVGRLRLGVLAFLVVTAVPGTRSAASADESALCGEPGQPPCPLQGWMRSQLGAPLARREFEQLARNLERLAQQPPGEGFETWAERARVGARAAAAQDMPALRAACRACHDEHRARYRKEKRQLPAPP
jgi:hypothetical protein